MEAVDKNVPLPVRDVDKPMAMPIEDISRFGPRHGGHGNRARQSESWRRSGIVGFRPTQKKVVTGVEMFKEAFDEGIAGDTWSLLAARKKKTWDADRLCKPGSITPHTKFKAKRTC